MRITGIHATEILPVRRFEIDGLSDVVVLAGANGVGKTRLLEWLIGFFRSIPSSPDDWITVEATYRFERETWEKSTLDTRNTADADLLRATLQRNRKRSDQRSTVLNFESDRSIAQIKPYTFTFAARDPFDEEIGWDVGLSYLRDRFQDTQHSIFRKVQSSREAMARDAEKLIREAQKELREAEESKKAGEVGEAAKSEASESSGLVQLNPKKYPDPITPFRDAFSQLLAPKELLDPDLQKQVLEYSDDGNPRPIASLSSGEREVVNIVFDFILRKPSDCIVIFDEPELHLHPELSYRLIQTLKSVGRRNQFIFSTHSADIISASLDNSVVFITPPHADLSNQAMLVQEDDETHQALKLIGQSIGIVALGRRIVLIEGEHSSLDKQTYGAILQNRFPNLVLVPSGGKSTIQSFSHIQERVLNRTMWGVEFFMLCDRDASPAGASSSVIKKSSGSRLRQLPRYHLENYFLDETVIAQIFATLEPSDSWLRSPAAIREKLKEIAQRYISHAAALIVSSTLRERAGNLDIMPTNSHAMSASELAEAICSKAEQEKARIDGLIDPAEIDSAVHHNIKYLEKSIESGGAWKAAIPGRPIIQTFCSSEFADMDFGRFKLAYLKAAENASTDPFADVVKIFDEFAGYPN